MITALNLSNNILKRAFKENINVSSMKLNKLIYIIYKEYYIKTNKVLFVENFEAWRYGPVLSSIFYEFQEFKSHSIRRYVKEYDGSILLVKENDYNFKKILDSVWNKYKYFNGIKLSEMLCKENTAWYKAISSNKSYLLISDMKEEDLYI